MGAAERKQRQRARDQFPRRQWDEASALNKGTEKACKALGIDPSDKPDLSEDVMPRLQALARRYTVHSFRKVLELTNSADDRVAFAAACEVLARGWGRTPVVVQQQAAAQAMSREELDAKIAEALLRLRDRMQAADSARVVAVQHQAEVAKDCPPAQVLEKTVDES